MHTILAMMRVQLTLSAQSLKNTSRMRLGAADPYAVVSYTGGKFDGQEIGRTETLENTLNPIWITILFVDIDPAVYMPFRVSIFDDNVNRQQHTLMAEATFEMTSVCQSPGNTQTQETLIGNGNITVNVEKSIQGSARGKLVFQMRGLNVKNVESGVWGLGRSDPFYEISKKNADHEKGIVRWSPVYRSEKIDDNLNPFFNEHMMSLEELCYCDLDWPLRISIFDWEKSGKHKLIGQIDTTVKELSSRVSKNGNADRESAFEMYKEGSDTRRGLIVVLKADVKLD